MLLHSNIKLVWDLQGERERLVNHISFSDVLIYFFFPMEYQFGTKAHEAKPPPFRLLL